MYFFMSVHVEFSIDLILSTTHPTSVELIHFTDINTDMFPKIHTNTNTPFWIYTNTCLRVLIDTDICLKVLTDIYVVNL